MKKIVSILLVIITCFSLFALAACKDDDVPTPTITPTPTPTTTPQRPTEDVGMGYLAKDGETDYRIVISKNAGENEIYASSELSAYMRVSSNVKITIETDEEETFSLDNHVISIGDTIYRNNVDLSDVDYSELESGGYIIKSFKNVYIIDSASRDGRIYGVYKFLERFFGIEFISYDTTYDPKYSVVVAEPIDLVDIPAFGVRDYYAYDAFYRGGVQLGLKLRNNSSRFASSEIIDQPYYYTYYCNYQGNPNWFSERMGHTIVNLLAADAYEKGINPAPNYKTNAGGAHSGLLYGYYGLHPEWYAYDPNSKYANSHGRSQWEICYSNGLTEDGNYDEDAENSLIDKMIEICQRMILDERNDGSRVIMLGHGDDGSKCHCDKCERFYEKFGTFGGVTCVWANAIVGKVKEWMKQNDINKNVKFVIFAYNISRPAPVVSDGKGGWTPVNEKVVLDEDIGIQMAYRVCNYHSIWDEKCEHNQELREQFSQWVTIAKWVEIWDYQSCFRHYLWYLPNLQTLKDNYQYYMTINVNRVLSQGAPGEGRYYMYDLNQWLCLQLMWNPDQDVKALIKHFNLRYFGEKYSLYANLFIDMFENHFAILDEEYENGFHATTDTSLGFHDSEHYSYELLNGIINMLKKGLAELESDQTLTQSQKDDLRMRFAKMMVTPQYMMLQLGYIVDSNEKKQLATEFFENIELAGCKYMYEGDSLGFAEWKKQFGLE